MVVFYTIDCPKCLVLEKKMELKGVKFEKVDNKDIIVEEGRKANILSAPFLKVDDKYLDFSQAVKWLND